MKRNKSMNIWQELTHENILNTVEKSLGEKMSNLLLKRNSYINRVYELEKYDSRDRIIVKFYRPNRWTKEQILEEHNFLFELAEQEVAVISPLRINNQTLFELGPIYYSLFPKKGGRAMDEFNKESWEEIGRLIARIHLVGQKHKEGKRIIWKPSTATKHHIDVLYNSSFLVSGFERTFKEAAAIFMKKAESLFNNQEFILLHGDCHKGNLIHRLNEGIFIVDFDDIAYGPPVQDLWLLLPDVPDNCEKELEWFLKGYEVFRRFDRKSLDLVPILRGMRIIHYASWLAAQSKDSDFKTNFPEAGNTRYWNSLIKELQEIVYN